MHRDTILSLLVRLGDRCQRIMDEKIQNVSVRDVQADEIWGYVFKKEKHKRFSESENTLIGGRLHVCCYRSKFKAGSAL